MCPNQLTRGNPNQLGTGLSRPVVSWQSQSPNSCIS